MKLQGSFLIIFAVFFNYLEKHKFIQKARKEKLQQEQEQEQQAKKALVLSIRGKLEI